MGTCLLVRGAVSAARIVACAGALGVAPVALSSPLSDADLYYDPPSLPDGVYPIVDLVAGGQFVFNSTPGRTIVGANILPILKNNVYGPGYAFSQSDYLHQPNMDYFADITAGTLTTDFDRTGAYHVRVLYGDNSFEVSAIMVDAGIGNSTSGTETPISTCPWVEIAQKPGDVYVIADGSANDGFIKNAEKLLMGKRIVKNATKVQDIIDAAEDAADDLGRQVRVVVVGHGNSGFQRIGADGANPEYLDGTNGPGLAASIDEFAESINLMGCKVGDGQAGGDLLAGMTRPGLSASAYDKLIGNTSEGWFVKMGATKVPGPGALGLVGLLAIGAARRRRG